MSRYTIAEYSKKLLVVGQKAKNRVANAQHEFAEYLCEEVKKNAPVDTGAYRDSIKVSETVWDGDTVTTSVYSDMLVGGDNPKWQNVPLGSLLEWGTGLKGLQTNTQNHGFPYRMTPWRYYYKKIGQWVTTIGMIARPHFLPAMLLNKRKYVREIRKAVFRFWEK